MDIIFDFNWISLFALSIFFLAFIFLRILSKKIKWIYVVLISLVLGIGLGLLFSSENNKYLIWTDMIGSIYVNVIKALVAPIILISVFSSFVLLKNKSKMKSIGLKSVIWLLTSAVLAIVLSLAVGLLFKVGTGAGAIFENITSVSDSKVVAYQGLTKSFDEVIINLFPSNFITDLGNNNVVAIIIIAIAFALGYIAVSKKEGENAVKSFKDFILAFKKVLFKVLEVVVSLTPYAVLCIIAGSASSIFKSVDSMIQLLILVVLIYAVSFIHTYLLNGALVTFVAKLNPIKFFKKTFSIQATAFVTQSSVGTLPITTEVLRKKVGIKEEVADFTAPLGTTIGMPGCTCIWPILLVIYYVNAVGLSWGFGDYVVLAILTLLFSLGSAGVPGIAIVSAVGLFSAINLPVAAVILFIPINTISDMVRTLDNVSTATVASAIVARKTNNIDDDIFNDKKEYVEEKENSLDSYEGIEEKKEVNSFGCCGSNFLDEASSDDVILLVDEAGE